MTTTAEQHGRAKDRCEQDGRGASATSRIHCLLPCGDPLTQANVPFPGPTNLHEPMLGPFPSAQYCSDQHGRYPSRGIRFLARGYQKFIFPVENSRQSLS